jgi:hypothetical protein
MKTGLWRVQVKHQARLAQQQRNRNPMRERRLEDLLTRCQTVSAVSFGGFLFLHLAAPLAAIPYGEQGATSTMLIARELYQARAIEPALVYGSVLVHVTAGLGKRLLRKSPAFSWHQIAGYALLPVVVGHVWNHRIWPAQLTLSPEFVNYSFVTHSLHQKPVRAWLGYLALIGMSAYHVTAGIRCLWARRRKQAVLRGKAWQGTAAGLACSLGLGLARLAAEPAIPGWLAKRYAVLL